MQRLVEVLMLLRRAEDLALYRAEMAAWPGGTRPWQESIADRLGLDLVLPH